jgi:hypothetical protein
MVKYDILAHAWQTCRAAHSVNKVVHTSNHLDLINESIMDRRTTNFVLFQQTLPGLDFVTNPFEHQIGRH